MNIEKLAATLRARGFAARVHRTDEPEVEDDAVHVTDRVQIQVGMGYWLVSKEEGEGDEVAWWFFDSREIDDVDGIVEDLRSALADGVTP